MSSPAIVANQLSKRYRSGAVGLARLDLDVGAGEIFCIVGPNGAGKTTALRILSTQLMPSSGNASVLGYDVVRQPASVRSRIAVVPQEASPDPEISAWDHVFYYLVARGFAYREARERAEWALAALDLWGQHRIPSAHLSGGMRKRVLVAMAVATTAPILFLDEISAGLDPVARRSLWRTIKELGRRSTVILTTHAMDEAETLADRVAILSAGGAIRTGTPRDLIGLMAAREKVILAGDFNLEELRPFGKVERIAEKTIVYPCNEDAMQYLLRTARERSIEAILQPVGLEDVFISLVAEG